MKIPESSIEAKRQLVKKESVQNPVNPGINVNDFDIDSEELKSKQIKVPGPTHEEPEKERVTRKMALDMLD